jgi:MoxR-like ATPase
MIDASKSVAEVFEATKRAMLPEVFFLLGPKGSGKSSVAQALSQRTNMNLLNFENFLVDSGFNPKDYDDEEVTLALVRHMVQETSPRILIEDFPRTAT